MIENEIFKALADPTRRAIFEKLASGSMNASALRDGMDISQPAMSQHLSVLVTDFDIGATHGTSDRPNWGRTFKFAELMKIIL